MINVIDILKGRGFIEQIIHEDELYDYINSKAVTCYIGFDPTASSLHVGSLIPIMALAHMQRNGHQPIALLGGGTGLIGDPSGKTEMRKFLDIETLNENEIGIKKQLSRFIDFNQGKAILLNNKNWLTTLNYIQFLRDIGKYFNVNKMIKAESYKIRLESEEGLNFIEFNYMLLQAYDFLELYKRYGCILQMGGSDQWGNIIAGMDLIKKICQETVFGVTFPLITTSSGAKMGKTAKGAIWLDPFKTSPYEYYQYWVNTDDKDVSRFLALFTFLPMDEIEVVENLGGAELNNAKAILAFETTALVHGRDEAVNAYNSACKIFGIREIPDSLIPSSGIPRNKIKEFDNLIPTTYIEAAKLLTGIPAYKLFVTSGILKSSGEARRLIEQGGAYINNNRIASYDYLVTYKDIESSEILLRIGKKKYHRIKING